MKKIDWSFPRRVFITLMIVGAGGAYPLVKYGTSEVREAVLIGALITTLNVLAGYAAIEYSYGKSMTTFLQYVLGGMGIRMFALGAVLVLLIRVFGFHTEPLVWSIVCFYVLFLALEISFIQKKFTHR